MAALKRLASETAIYGLTTIVARLFNYLLTPYWTRMLPEQKDFGIVTQVYAYVAFFMVLYTFRMETAFFRFEKEDKKAFSTTSLAVLGVSTVLSALIWLGSDALASFLEIDKGGTYIQYIALIMFFDAASAIPFAQLRVAGKAVYFGLLKVANIAITMGLNFFFFSFAKDAWTRGDQWVEYIYSPDVPAITYIFVANFAASLFTFFFLLPTFIRFQQGFDPQLFKRIMKYTWPLIIVGMAGIANEVLDRVLLKHLLTGDLNYRDAQVGIYGASYRLAMLMSIFTQAFNFAADPFFFRNAKNKDAPELYAYVARLFGIFLCLVFLGESLYLPILQYFLGENYREALHIVPIVLMANLCLGLYYNVSTWFKIKDKTLIGMYIALGGAAITILANLILVPYIGYEGAAWATLICYAYMLVHTYLSGQKHYPVPYPVKDLLFYIFGAIAVYLLSGLIIEHVFIEMLTETETSIPQFTLNTLLFGSYLAIVYFIEKPKFIAHAQR